jgi:hypothetical protein
LAWSAAACGLGCASDPPTSAGASGAGGTGSPSAGASAGGSSATAGSSSTAGSSTAGTAGTTASAGTTGAGGSAGSGNGSGGGGAGGGSAGATAGLDCTGRIVCDDFEKGAVAGGKPAAPWKLRQDNGTVTFDDTRAVSGKYSVKVAVTATTAESTYRRALLNLDGAPLIPIAGNKVYGRFMIYTDRIPDKSVHWTFAHGDGPYADSGTTATYNYGGMGGLMANYYRDTKPEATDCWQTKNETFTTGKWQCVGFLFDGPNNEMRFWMGPSEVNEVHVLGNQKSDATCTVKGVDGKWYAPTFKNISIGWESYQHDVAGAHDAWLDDVILDDEPIPCP